MKSPFTPRHLNYGQWKKFEKLIHPGRKAKFKKKFKIKGPLLKSFFKKGHKIENSLFQKVSLSEILYQSLHCPPGIFWKIFGPVATIETSYGKFEHYQSQGLLCQIEHLVYPLNIARLKGWPMQVVIIFCTLSGYIGAYLQ